MTLYDRNTNTLIKNAESLPWTVVECYIGDVEGETVFLNIHIKSGDRVVRTVGHMLASTVNDMLKRAGVGSERDLAGREVRVDRDKVFLFPDAGCSA